MVQLQAAAYVRNRATSADSGNANAQLEEYNDIRDFRKRPAPTGEEDNVGRKRIFVIHKHDASQLHYDFRLRIGDVLASWAVPKGLSTEANDKRLAIRVEDHPLDYADFEGVIPEGEYGAGTVMVWDQGTYAPILDEDEKSMEDAREGGSLKFELHGEKLKGGFAMARTGKRDGKEQWVIFKLDDEHADARRKPTSTEPNSVKTGRSLEEIEAEEGKDA